MKPIIYTSLGIIVFLVLLSSCSIFRPKKIDRRSIFSLNAIQADQDYFTKAVLEYHLVNAILKKKGNVIRQTIDSTIIDSMVVYAYDEDDYSSIISCRYKIPMNIRDLNSGFQYRYYLFSGESTAVMQAFGITDISSNYDTKYLIIDYIQYRDCKCGDLPTIRYGVGIRSELKISKSNTNTEITGIGGLANLAAQVQLGHAEVNFSLKTIGITGEDSRLNIPQGVSFDVTTYKDFQNSIEFIKEKIDDEGVIISPELIPVMDEYRPNSQESLDGITEKIILLHQKIKKVKEDKRLTASAKEEVSKLYQDEIKRLLKQRSTIDSINSTLYSLRKYESMLSRALTPKEQKKSERWQESLFVKDITTYDYYPGKPKISNLDFDKIQALENLYYESDAISYDAYESFLNSWEALDPTNADLDIIIKRLEEAEIPTPGILSKTLEELTVLRQNQ